MQAWGLGGGSCWCGCLWGLPEPRGAHPVCASPCLPACLPACLSAARQDTESQWIITWLLLSGFRDCGDKVTKQEIYTRKPFYLLLHMTPRVYLFTYFFTGEEIINISHNLNVLLCSINPPPASLGVPRPGFGNQWPLIEKTPISGALWWYTWWMFRVEEEGGVEGNHDVFDTNPPPPPRWFHFVSGVLLRSAAVAVNWKCQTCRLTVASRACVINWTRHGTPNEGSCPSAMKKITTTTPTIDNECASIHGGGEKPQNVI